MTDDNKEDDKLPEEVGGLNESSRDWVQDNKPLLKKGFFILVAVIVGGWGWHHYHRSHAAAVTPSPQAMQSSHSVGAGKIFSFNKPPPPKVVTASTSTASVSVAGVPPPKGHVDVNTATDKPIKTWVSAPIINTSSGSLIPQQAAQATSPSSSGLSAHDQAQIVALQAQQLQSQSITSAPPQTALGGLLQGTQTTQVSAQVLAHQNTLLTKGTFINAVLDTKIDSTVAGLTKCTVTHNIYSVNGATLLIPKGSIVTGEYQSGVMQGQARLFVLWERLLTPSGVVVNLSSPSTGSLGGSGIKGGVITHFWKRFGGAIMLSFVNDFGNYLSNTGNSSTYSSTQQAAQQMATESLKNTINIPPTIIVNQGARIGIFVARDVDFSSVYQLIHVNN